MLPRISRDGACRDRVPLEAPLLAAGPEGMSRRSVPGLLAGVGRRPFRSGTEGVLQPTVDWPRACGPALLRELQPSADLCEILPNTSIARGAPSRSKTPPPPPPQESRLAFFLNVARFTPSSSDAFTWLPFVMASASFTNVFSTRLTIS